MVGLWSRIQKGIDVERWGGEIAHQRGRREMVLEELSEINPTDPGNTRSFA